MYITKDALCIKHKPMYIYATNKCYIFGLKYDWVVSRNHKESPQTMVKELKLAK